MRVKECEMRVVGLGLQITHTANGLAPELVQYSNGPGFFCNWKKVPNFGA